MHNSFIFQQYICYNKETIGKTQTQMGG